MRCTADALEGGQDLVAQVGAAVVEELLTREDGIQDTMGVAMEAPEVVVARRRAWVESGASQY